VQIFTDYLRHPRSIEKRRQRVERRETVIRMLNDAYKKKDIRDITSRKFGTERRIGDILRRAMDSVVDSTNE
jgi:hypothetical protein